jgi:calcineurin-like phosphoesterase family protein
MKYFITSDLHFNHKNIIEYSNRPFNSVEEMNETLINNWNSVVSMDDIVYIDGDLAFGSKGKIREILNRLNGSKILIKGNHDWFKNLPIECFIRMEKKFEIINVEGQDYIIIHDPSAASADHTSNYKYLCGHLHSMPENRVYRNWIDIGVDGNNFYPYELNEAIKMFNIK